MRASVRDATAHFECHVEPHPTGRTGIALQLSATGGGTSGGTGGSGGDVILKYDVNKSAGAVAIDATVNHFDCTLVPVSEPIGRAAHYPFGHARC